MIDLPSFSVGAVTSRWPSVRRGSGCGPRLLVPHSTGRSLSRPARTLPCSPDCSREPLRSRALRFPLSSSRATGCFGVSTRPAMSRGRVRPPLAVESRCSAPLSGAPSGGGGALVSSMVLGPAADASNIRPVTSAPSPPSRCFRSPTAGFRGSYHRRVQRADEVCCNFERRCSFLGFDPPPRSLPGPPVRPRSRRSSARVDRRSLGGPSRSRSPRRPRSRGLLQWSRTVARGRLFEGRGGVPAGFEAAESVPAWGFVHVKERLSRLRRSSRRPVKEWLLPLSR